MREVGHEDFSPSNSLQLASLGGIGAEDGRPVLLELPAGATSFVAFILHATSLQHDLDFWERVQKQWRGSKTVRFVGYCDGLRCVEALRAMRPILPLPVIGFAEYHTARVLERADAEGRALLLDHALRARAGIRWTAASEPRLVATEIEAAAVRP